MVFRKARLKRYRIYGFDTKLLSKHGTSLFGKIYTSSIQSHAELENIIDENMANLMKHIALYFHKFLKKNSKLSSRK